MKTQPKKPISQPELTREEALQQAIDALDSAITEQAQQRRPELEARHKQELQVHDNAVGELHGKRKVLLAELKRLEDAKQEVEAKPKPDEMLGQDAYRLLNVSETTFSFLIRTGQLVAHINAAGVKMYKRAEVEALRTAREQAKQNEFSAKYGGPLKPVETPEARSEATTIH